MPSRHVRIVANQRPCDCCRGESLFEVWDAMGSTSCSALFLPAVADGVLQLRPSLSIPQTPCGKRVIPDELQPTIDVDFFDDMIPAAGAMVADLEPPRPSIEPPLQRLAAAVEAEATRAAQQSNSTDTPSIEYNIIQDLKAAITAELSAPHLATSRISKGGLGILASRHSYPVTARLPCEDGSCDAVADDETAAGRAVIVLEFCDRMTTSRVKERWEILDSQPLNTVFDKLDCASDQLPYPHSSDAFLFLGGCFYVAGDPQRVCENIRSWKPVAGGVVDEPPYGRCPILPLTTTAGKLSVRIGEKGVFRHHGVCDHIVSVVAVGGANIDAAARPIRDYPRKVFSVPDRVTNCDVCRGLPANVMTYFDRLAPTHPALYCLSCYELLHGADQSGDGTEAGAPEAMITFKLPLGVHF